MVGEGKKLIPGIIEGQLTQQLTDLVGLFRQFPEFEGPAILAVDLNHGVIGFLFRNPLNFGYAGKW